MTEKRLTFFDVERINRDNLFRVMNGSYSVVLKNENEAYMVCQMINRIIQDLEIVGAKIKQEPNFEQRLRDNPMPTKTLDNDKYRIVEGRYKE